jgi:hypothetical protein
MTLNPEQGIGWEVRRGFVPGAVAEAAGQQVLALIASAPSYMVEREHFERDKALKTYTFYEDEFRAAIMANPELQVVGEAIDAVGSCSSSLREYTIFNLYARNGYLGKHRDIGSGDTATMRLVGQGCLSIRDCEEEKWHDFLLGPGDLIRFTNGRRFSDRPLHKFRNLGNDICLTLVR